MNDLDVWIMANPEVGPEEIDAWKRANPAPAYTEEEIVIWMMANPAFSEEDEEERQKYLEPFKREKQQAAADAADCAADVADAGGYVVGCDMVAGGDMGAPAAAPAPAPEPVPAMPAAPAPVVSGAPNVPEVNDTNAGDPDLPVSAIAPAPAGEPAPDQPAAAASTFLLAPGALTPDQLASSFLLAPDAPAPAPVVAGTTPVPEDTPGAADDPGSAPAPATDDPCDPTKTVSADGTYFVYICNEQASSSSVTNPASVTAPEPALDQPFREGWTMAEGSNFWSVDEASPYWETEEGRKEVKEAKERGAWIEQEASAWARENPGVDAPNSGYWATDGCGEGKQPPGSSCSSN
jgi:hypothetical protein